MNTVPLIPDSAPFSPEQRAWLNGFFAGMFSRAPLVGGVPSPREASATLTPLTILFGSQTGTAESLAKKAAKEAGKRGFAATVLDMAQTDAAKLTSEKNVLLIVSTYGEGEPPDTAKALHTALASESAPPLAGVRFSVCSLGDTNYTQFCQCGKDFDARLEKLGATRITPRVDCDLDYEEPFTKWLDAALSTFGSEVGRVIPNAPSPAATAAEEESSAYSKKNPFPALLLASRNLNAPGSSKQVHHVEFSLEGSGLIYEAGDALGVFAQNCPEHVSDVLSALGCDGEEEVPAPDGSTTSLRRALTELYDLGKPPADLLGVYGTNATGGGTAVALHHVVDVILAAPAVKLSPTDFVRTLKRLQPRLYSISSSPRAH
ncbi:MAG: flavodoxin domain-containing protein, partial [Opitutaceae bacterium]